MKTVRRTSTWLKPISQTLAVAFMLLGLSGFAAHRQAAVGSIDVLDRAGRPTTAITDGDTVTIRATLTAPVSAPETFRLRLDDLDSVISSCDISSGTLCVTSSFSTLGWHWDAGGVARGTRLVKAFDSRGTLVAQSAALTVRPRPVVMVHGFLSSADTWKAYLGPGGFLAGMGLMGFAVGDGQVPGTMNTGSFSNPTARTNTMAQNAAIEAQYIAEVKKATGAQVVDLLGHSMGGMISRYYIDRLMPERDVAQLIMLGSPMGGSDCSVLPASLGFFLPASVEIRQSYMQGVFNRQITHRKGVPFYDLAGTAISKPFQSPCAPVPNDLAVSVSSVRAIPLDSSESSFLHTELTSSPVVFHDFVLPLLQKPVGTFADAPDPTSSISQVEPLQFTRVYTGQVTPGHPTEVSITIEPNVTVASFAMYDPTRSVGVSVRGASGNVIQLDPQANGFIRVDDSSSMVYLGYGFANPKPGIWKVTVLPTAATPASGADFAISVYFVGGAQLAAQSDTLTPRLGETVHFTASLALAGQPLEITQAQAVIRDPAGHAESRDLQPGNQAVGEWTPRMAGTHGVDLVVTGRAPDGTSVQRTAFLAEEVQPNPTQLRVSLNLVLLIGAVLAVLVIIVLVLARLLRRIFRGQRSA